MNLTKHIFYKIKYINRAFLKFASVEFFFWATYSMYSPFIVVYLMEKGLDNTAIGAIVSLNSAIAFLAQPFWGMASDKLRSVKKVFIINLAAASIIWFLMPYNNSIILITLAFCLLVFFESPLAPLLDSWVVQDIKEHNLSYGPIRLWGSVGFAIVLFITGKLIDTKGTEVIFTGFGLFAFLTILISTTLKNKPSAITRKEKISPMILLKDKKFLSFVIFAMFLTIPNRASYLYLPVLMENAGGTSGDLSIAISVIALSEIPVFILSSFLLKKFDPVKLLIISAVFFTIRQFLFLIVETPFQIILMQVTNGLSFALFLTASVYYVDILAPEKLKATAQTLSFAIFSALGGILAGSLGGIIIDNAGLDYLYISGIIISIINTAVFILFNRFSAKTYALRP